MAEEKRTCSGFSVCPTLPDGRPDVARGIGLTVTGEPYADPPVARVLVIGARYGGLVRVVGSDVEALLGPLSGLADRMLLTTTAVASMFPDAGNSSFMDLVRMALPDLPPEHIPPADAPGLMLARVPIDPAASRVDLELALPGRDAPIRFAVRWEPPPTPEERARLRAELEEHERPYRSRKPAARRRAPARAAAP